MLWLSRFLKSSDSWKIGEVKLSGQDFKGLWCNTTAVYTYKKIIEVHFF